MEHVGGHVVVGHVPCNNTGEDQLSRQRQPFCKLGFEASQLLRCN